MTTSIMIPRVKPAWRDKDNTGCSVFSSIPSATIPVRGCSNCNGYKKKNSNFRHSGLRSKQKQNLACWKNWAQHLFDAPRYAEDGRAHHRVPYGEATTGERAEKPSEQAGGSKTEGGHDQEGAAQHSHGDDAGVFGGVVTAGDFKSRSKRTVNVDFLWRGDDVVGRALKR